MRKTLFIAAAGVCLLLMIALGAQAEGYETPKDIVLSYIRSCSAALDQCPDIPERSEAFPRLLEELSGFLARDSGCADDLRRAASLMRQPGGEAARQASKLLNAAYRALGEGDIPAPFSLSDLSVARDYALLPVTDMAQFIRVFSQKAGEGRERFAMICPQAVCEAMRQSTTCREDLTLLTDVANQCGVRQLSQVYFSDCWLLLYDDLDYFPGVRIAKAWREGRVDALSAEERQTLEAALQIAGAASGSELERERQIHDALCRRITYYTEAGESGRKDSAVGALLDGMAECDGYSDAFYLCGTLAGLQVRYITGDSVEPPAAETAEGEAPDAAEEWVERVDVDGGHMWNLICLDGRWVSVDVTWDDGDSGAIFYANYNLGAERMGLTHLWDERTRVVGMESGLDNALRDPSLAVSTIGTWEELYGVCRRAAASRPERLTIACPVDQDVREAGDWIGQCLYSTGVEGYRWHAQNAVLELFALEYAPAFQICDTAGEAEAAIEAWAAEGVRDFSLYFSPELSAQMFANAQAGIDALIGASSLADTRYSYNEGERRVCVSGAQYHSSRNLAASLEDIGRILRQRLGERWDSAWFVLPADADFDGLSDGISRIVYACGAMSYSWSLCGGRVTLTDIAYYPEFALVSDEQQLAEYIISCRSRGVAGFRAYCDGELYAAMSADGFSRFFRLLGECGCGVDGIGYDEASGALVVDDAAW